MTESSAMQRLVIFSLSFFSLVLAIYVLAIGSSFFVPLAIAIVISYIFIAIAEGLVKISIGDHRIPYFLAYVISLGIFAIAFYFVFYIMQNSITAIIHSTGIYQEKINSLTNRISQLFDLKEFDIFKYFNQFDFNGVLRQTAVTLTEIASHAGIIIVYILFILIEYGFFADKLIALFPNKDHYRMATGILTKINDQILSYLRIKTALGAATALCSYVVLRLVGVDFPDFWAMLIFLLNYIPTIGSILATFFPCLLSLLQFDTFTPFIIVCTALISIQFIFGNILEPRIMGKKFNLSGLVIILSLSIWGKIWGVIGMFLCMPFLVILNIILSNFAQTRPIVVLLSRNGEIEKIKSNHPKIEI